MSGGGGPKGPTGPRSAEGRRSIGAAAELKQGKVRRDLFLRRLELPAQTKFGIWLRERRAERGMTQIDLGRAMGKTGDVINGYERKMIHPSIPAAQDLALTLGIPFTELYEIVEESITYLHLHGQIVDKFWKPTTELHEQRKQYYNDIHNGKHVRHIEITLPTVVAQWYAKLAEREGLSLNEYVKIRVVDHFAVMTDSVPSDYSDDD